jgi:hypothetical protein
MAEVEAKAPEDKVANVPAPESAVEETAGKFTASLSASFFPHHFGANGGNVALLENSKIHPSREIFLVTLRAPFAVCLATKGSILSKECWVLTEVLTGQYLRRRFLIFFLAVGARYYAMVVLVLSLLACFHHVARANQTSSKLENRSEILQGKELSSASYSKVFACFSTESASLASFTRFWNIFRMPSKSRGSIIESEVLDRRKSDGWFL